MVTYTNPEKFEGYKPLLEYPTDHYASKYDLHYNKFEEPKHHELHEIYWGEKTDKVYPPFVFGLLAKPRDFIKYDFLYCLHGAELIVHNRVVDILTEWCAGDFQTFDTILKNYNPNGEPFENHDFKLVNVFHTVNALNLDESEFRISPTGLKFVRKRVYKDEDIWDGHFIGYEATERRVLFHPKLAKKFKYSKGVQFLTDKEAPC